LVWNKRIKAPGFEAFRDEVYIAEKGEGYKSANMRNFGSQTEG
jgi:hypothetical protein